MGKCRRKVAGDYKGSLEPLIPLHPYYLRYHNWILGRFSNKKELLEFLKMVNLKESKL